MRKTLLLLAFLALTVGQSIASPVDVSRAQRIGLKFMQGSVSRQVEALSLAYTQVAENGTTALYVFNAGNGFVVVAADDVAQPILGYSDEGIFDASHMPDGFAYFLRYFARQIEYAVENNLATDPETAEQWERVSREGFMIDNREGRAVAPLLSTLWDQGYPYNYYAPMGGPSYMGGHCYAGCVATSMSQVMKYWNWPETGTGEHSYSTSTNGGTLSANFGETTYEWAIMPNQLGYTATNAAKAVALLMYHCGISVDMDYKASASGAHTEDVPYAAKTYFKYASCTNLQYRDAYTKTEWEDMLIESFDKGYPVIYSGTEPDGSSGHAFNCDGYNNQRLFHFNWGWSGSYNNYFATDALNVQGDHFNAYQRVVFDMIPDYIYNAMLPAAENLAVEASNAHSKTGIVSWTNPTVNFGGESITNIDKVVLLRDGVEIFSQTNAIPGQNMTFEDHVANYDSYSYTVYYLSNNYQGDVATIQYQFGPTCTWRIIGQSSNFQGWSGGKIQILNAFGTVAKEVTMTTSSMMNELVRVPEGELSFRWVDPSVTISNMTIVIKNSSNTTVYNYSGPSTNLNGVIATITNDCDGCQPPTELDGTYQWTGDGFGTLLTWTYEGEPQSFKVYRSTDGVDYVEIATVNKADRSYFDVTETGAYYYKVTAYRSYCESTPAWVNDNQDYVYIGVTSVDENDDDCFKVYPNPAHSTLCIEAEGMEQITICNVLGQVVYQQPCDDDGVVVSTSALPAGIYHLTVKTAQTTLTKRLMVVH